MLAWPSADASHQTFLKMFVQTEYVGKLNTILATRRKRSPDEPDIWAGRTSRRSGRRCIRCSPEMETDRARFLRAQPEEDCGSPLALDGGGLSNTMGTVLDPVFALRYRVRVPGKATARVTFWTGVAATRQGVLDLLAKYRESSAFERAAVVAPKPQSTQARLRELGIDATAARPRISALPPSLLYANSSLRSLARNDTDLAAGRLRGCGRKRSPATRPFCFYA